MRAAFPDRVAWYDRQASLGWRAAFVCCVYAGRSSASLPYPVAFSLRTPPLRVLRFACTSRDLSKQRPLTLGGRGSVGIIDGQRTAAAVRPVCLRLLSLVPNVLGGVLQYYIFPDGSPGRSTHKVTEDPTTTTTRVLLPVYSARYLPLCPEI